MPESNSLTAALDKFAASFWARVDRSGGPEACWPWLGWTDRDGYGRTWFAGKHEGTHRIAYALTFGPVEPGVKILHECDNPSCCNALKHLRPGTHLENMRDRSVRNRVAKGESNGRCKITAEQAREIRQLTITLPTRIVAERLGVSRHITEGIKQGRTWKHI